MRLAAALTLAAASTTGTAHKIGHVRPAAGAASALCRRTGRLAMAAPALRTGDEVKVISDQVFFHVPKQKDGFVARGLIGTVERVYDPEQDNLSPVHPIVVSFTEPCKWKVRTSRRRGPHAQQPDGQHGTRRRSRRRFPPLPNGRCASTRPPASRRQAHFEREELALSSAEDSDLPIAPVLPTKDVELCSIREGSGCDQVRDFMTPIEKAVILNPDMPMRVAAELLSKNGITGAPVAVGGKLVGVLTQFDFL
jgi:hypothetical protein